MMRRADYNLARMSGMLDLSRDEKAKHFLPVAICDQFTHLVIGKMEHEC